MNANRTYKIHACHQIPRKSSLYQETRFLESVLLTSAIEDGLRVNLGQFQDSDVFGKLPLVLEIIYRF